MNPEAETVRDAELLEAVGGGDERAFAELHRRYAAVVFSFVLARTADRGAADSQVLTWLLGIAKRQIWTHARRRRIPTAPLDEEIENLADDADDPAGLVAAAVSVDELVAALRSLPEDLAEVVDLAWLHELPYAQIASTLGIPAGTVKSRVSRARRILKDALRKDALRSDDA